ncbi:MAG: hypothetical protein WDO17_07815 [Alphaproteobacteria bacterium]
MMEFLQALLAAIPAAASSAYGLAAYALAAAACVFFIWRVVRNKNLLEHIEKLPPKDRRPLIELEMTGARLAKGLSPEQWLRAQIYRYSLAAFLAVCAAVAVVVVFAGVQGVQINNSVTNISNDFRQINNQPLSEEDRQLMREAVAALKAKDPPREQAAVSRLSAPARAAFLRAAPAIRENSPGSPAGSSSTGTPPPAVAAESEPNNDFFTANEIPVNTPIDAAIEPNSDVDYFKFVLPGSKRDIVDVVVTNQSMTLAPILTLHDGNKNAWESKTANTRGADVSYNFVAEPGETYYVKISPYYDFGKYRLMVKTRDAYDRYEPNDNFLSATPIEIGKAIEANIMDSRDVDYFKFQTGSHTKLVAVLENRSSTLAPKINIADSNKNAWQEKSTSTRGADISYPFEAIPNSTYYVIVSAYYAPGEYTLTLRPQ